MIRRVRSDILPEQSNAVEGVRRLITPWRKEHGRDAIAHARCRLACRLGSLDGLVDDPARMRALMILAVDPPRHPPA